MRYRTTLAVSLAALVVLAPSAAHATFAGKNGPIAYSYLPGASNSGSANFEIVTQMPGEEPNFLLPQRPRKDNWPDWSPDGRRILTWYSAGGTNVDVYVMNADGSGQVNLTDENPTGFDAFAAFSPDGTEIVLGSDYATDTGEYEIQVMDADGIGFRQLTHSGGADDFPQFSPDGERIAFTRFSLTSEESWIYTMDAADGGHQVRVTRDGMYAFSPDWSPDGTRIVFVDNACSACSQQDLWLMNADGSGLTQLTNTPNEVEFRPGWSPDGRKLTFSSIPLTPEHPFGDLPADVYTMTAKGTGRTNITNTPDYQERAPDWGARVNGAPQG